MAPKKEKKEKKPKVKKESSFYGSGDGDDIQVQEEEKVKSSEQTFRLFRQGLKLEDIAKQRGYALSTVEAHLIPYVASGELNIDYLVSRPKQKLIMDALEDFSYETGLNPVKNSLPADISFSEIRYVMANKMKG